MNKGSLYELLKGLIKENPTFCLVLGLCPTLAVSTSLDNALGMGAAATFVLLGSNFIISTMRNSIPEKIRIPIYIIVIATFVTMVSLLMGAFLPDLNQALGIYIPLIVVNCIIMARAEAFAAKNNPLSSIMDGIGIGIGFTLSLSLISTIREILGTGALKLFNHTLISMPLEPALFFILPSGALMIMGLLLAFFSYLRKRKYSPAGCCEVKS